LNHNFINKMSKDENTPLLLSEQGHDFFDK
jgi:hypothetical protein